MLGPYLQYLRERAGLELAQVAAVAGLPTAELARIENSDAVRLPGELLLKLTDGLHLKQAQEFGRLLQLNGTTRRFRAFGVGLPRTGTDSLCGIFGNYVCVHDFWQETTRQHLISFRQERTLRAALAEFMLERDRAACAELDSANILVHAIEPLAELFPDARFIGLIRDPFSWVNAQINFFTLPEHQALFSPAVPNGFPFDLPRGANPAKVELLRNFPRYAEGVIAYWANTTRMLLAQLPRDRSLIVRTNDITRRVDDLAKFIGVPADTLCQNQTHMNRAEYHVNILLQCDRAWLHEKFAVHCGDLCAEHFPEFSLDRFLDSL